MSNIINKLEDACIVACGCLTKTPQFQYHAAECRYRVLNEAIEHIAEQAATIANHVKIAANDAATIAELRLQIRDAHEDAGNYRTSSEAEIAQLRERERQLKDLLTEVSRRFRDTPGGNSLVARIERALSLVQNKGEA